MFLYNKKVYNASQRLQIVLLSISLGALYWTLDSLVDSFIFNEGIFATLLFHPSLQEIWMRLFTMGLLVFFGIFTNRIIFKYKQTGESLRESEERYESVVENIGIGISVISPDMEILSLNSQMKKWFPDVDISKKPICYRAFNSPPRENICSYCPTCKTLSDGQTHESITNTPSGDEVRNYRVISSPVKDTEGKVIAAIEMVEDITERIRSEQALQDSEERYRSLFENANDLIQSVAPDGRLLYINPAWLKTMGYTLEELSGLTVFDILHPDYKTKCMNTLANIFSGESKNNIQVTFIAKDGRLIHLEGNANACFVNGRAAACNGIFHDVTERKKMEESLFQIKHDWEDTFNSITDMVTVHDKDFNIIQANKAAQKILHLDFLNMSPKKCFSFYHGTDSPPIGCPSCDCLKTGLSITTELYEPHLEMYLELSAIPRFDSSNKIAGLIHIARDITERKKLEDQLRQSQKMEAVGQLAGGIAHDFNNLLTAIIGYSTILKMKLKDDPLKINLDQILVSAEKGALLTQSLLTFSRQQINSPEPKNINEIIMHMEKLLLRVIGENIELKTIMTSTSDTGGKERNEDLIVMVDPVQMDQVLINLATNARDAMPEGGQLTIQTKKVHHSVLRFPKDDKYLLKLKDKALSNGGEFAEISFTDTGTGIDEKILERIFEPFFTTKDVGKGTGLGLSIVYGIIRQHNGYLVCESRHGMGTTFKIYLPIIKADLIRINNEAIRKDEHISNTILLAEDEFVVRKLTKQVLEEYGNKVIEAIDGEDAIKKFVDNQDFIDLLIFDIIMPRMSGQEAYERIKKIRPDIRVLLTSGYPSDFINKERIINEGISFVSKPVSPDKLMKKVKEVMTN